jgi:hypothetical protein
MTIALAKARRRAALRARIAMHLDIVSRRHYQECMNDTNEAGAAAAAAIGAAGAVGAAGAAEATGPAGAAGAAGAAAAASAPPAPFVCEVATGSVAGRTHRRMARPNQDAVAWWRGERGLVMIVCDGCGSGARSEVGAELTARLWLRALGERLAAGADVDEALFASAGDEVLAGLAAVCALLAGPDAAARRELVASHLLATSLCAVVTRERAAVHAHGDGVVGLGRERRVIGPFADNQPPYLALGLVGERPAGDTWLADADVGCALLATDGALALVDDAAGSAGELLDPEHADAARCYRNPATLTRRLGLLAEDTTAIDWAAGKVERGAALLTDDTTIALARWSTS